MDNWKYRIILFYIGCAFIIGYPFFAIDYFETYTAINIAAKYLLLPIFICLLIIGPKFYYRKVKPLDNNKPKTKFKENARDVISIIMMIICVTAIFFGVAFSLIITTNKLVGKSEIVKIKEPVEEYKTDITKNGRLRHYIDFKNPKTNEIISLEVYRKYKVGEFFKKEMKYGAWGILYSTD
ncbi:hypothetical protein [Flavobacterium sp. LB3R33]|uniref:hypothetical protein n=1 Tax=Flavobacterium sp. LB3R33 TaxID=3401721 RepID=UPI003AABDD79